jgi:hypothetical protein
MSGTPERIHAARDAWLAAKDSWLAGRAAHEAHRLEANRLWLEYLELADPVRARKIRRILKHGEQGAAKTADELFPAAMSLGQSIPGPQELPRALSSRVDPSFKTSCRREFSDHRPVLSCRTINEKEK